MSNVLHMHRRADTPIRVIRVAPPKPKQKPRPEVQADHANQARVASAPDKPLEPYRIPVDDEGVEERLQAEYERGRQHGLAEATAAIADRDAAEQEAVHQHLQTLFENMGREASRLTANLEREAYRFALAVAERIVKREVVVDENVVMRQMRESLRRIIGVDTITVRVHPSDEALIRAHRAALLTSSDAVREILVEGDETIGRGGCILESATGNVDARISSQLRQIENALFGAPLPSQEEAG